jgi:hypothetical protein
VARPGEQRHPAAGGGELDEAVGAVGGLPQLQGGLALQARAVVVPVATRPARAPRWRYKVSLQAAQRRGACEVQGARVLRTHQLGLQAPAATQAASSASVGWWSWGATQPRVSTQCTPTVTTRQGWP